jgi:hypothetical protein
MARIKCKCGAELNNQETPNDIQLKIYTDREWDEIINHDVIDPITIPFPKYEVWRCPKCERLYFFEDGNDNAVKIYRLEE